MMMSSKKKEKKKDDKRDFGGIIYALICRLPTLKKYYVAIERDRHGFRQYIHSSVNW